MPYDPSKPATNSQGSSAEMREQLTSLHQLIIDAEVNAATQLSNGITGTSNNSDSVGNLNLSVGNPPQQWELQAIADRLDQLINALRR